MTVRKLAGHNRGPALAPILDDLEEISGLRRSQRAKDHSSPTASRSVASSSSGCSIQNAGCSRTTASPATPRFHRTRRRVHTPGSGDVVRSSLDSPVTYGAAGPAKPARFALTVFQLHEQQRRDDHLDMGPTSGIR